MVCLTELWMNAMKVITIMFASSVKTEETCVIKERKVSSSEESTSNSQTVTTVVNQKGTLLKNKHFLMS